MRKHAHTLEQAAEALGVSRRTVYIEIAAGRLQAFTIGRWRLISDRALRRYVEAREPATEKVRRHAEACDWATALWSAARPASPRHRYLVAKGIQPYGVRADRGQLVLPVRFTSGEIHSLQFISP